MGILEGRVALVTGAGGRHGLGRAVALRLAGAGARLVLSDAQLPGAERPPGEVAALVVFLASEEAAMITGQAYNVNAGQLSH